MFPSNLKVHRNIMWDWVLPALSAVFSVIGHSTDSPGSRETPRDSLRNSLGMGMPGCAGLLAGDSLFFLALYSEILWTIWTRIGILEVLEETLLRTAQEIVSLPLHMKRRPRISS